MHAQRREGGWGQHLGVGIILCLPFILYHLFTGLIFGLTLGHLRVCAGKMEAVGR